MAVLVEGRDREDVAAVFKVSLRAVDGWWAKWQAGGSEALTARPRGRRVGEHQVLSGVEQAAARQAILDHLPCDLGLRGQVWTRGQVGELIAKLYRVRMTEPGVDKYLRRWGLSFQRPDKRAVEQNPQAVRTWLEETWRQRRARVQGPLRLWPATVSPPKPAVDDHPTSGGAPNTSWHSQPSPASSFATGDSPNEMSSKGLRRRRRGTLVLTSLATAVLAASTAPTAAAKPRPAAGREVWTRSGRDPVALWRQLLRPQGRTPRLCHLGRCHPRRDPDRRGVRHQ